MKTMRCNRRGYSILLVSLSISVLFLFTALTVDVGYLYYTKARLQMIADMAALSSLGSCSTNATIAAQQAYVNSAVNVILSANYGGALDKPVFTSTFNTTQTNGQNPAQLHRVTLDFTQGVSTTFWRVVGVRNVNLSARARVERLFSSGVATLPDGTALGVFASRDLTLSANNNCGGRFDSYDSRIGNYNPVNASTSLNAPHNVFHLGRLNLLCNGTFGVTNNNEINLFGSVRSVGSTNIRRFMYVRGDARSRGTVTVGAGTVITGATVSNDASFIAAAPITRPDLPSTSISDYDNALITASGAISAAQLSSAKAGDLNSGANGSFILPAGKRYLFNRLRATSANTALEISSSTSNTLPTRIWFTGATNAAAQLQGGLRLQSGGQNASHLLILGSGAAGSIDLTCRSIGGTTDTFCQILAPALDVTVSLANTANLRWFGAIIGANVVLDSAANNANSPTQSFVYDEALSGTITIGPSTVSGGTPEGVSSRVHLIE